MNALYQVVSAGRCYIWVRQAEAHDLAEHLLKHPFWQNSVRPSLAASISSDGNRPPRDGIEESSNRVFLPPGIPEKLLIGLQSIVDGWVTTKDGG
jgi:hypothetical protein